jgi:hypothetical protein
MEDLGDYTARQNELQSNFVKKDIDELLDEYDMDIDEFKRIFVERMERKKKQKQAQYAKLYLRYSKRCCVYRRTAQTARAVLLCRRIWLRR